MDDSVKLKPGNISNNLLTVWTIATARESTTEIWRCSLSSIWNAIVLYDCFLNFLTWFSFVQPENLLLDSQGNLKISDFGLSALPGDVRYLTMSHGFSILIQVAVHKCCYLVVIVLRESASFERLVALLIMLLLRWLQVLICLIVLFTWEMFEVYSFMIWLLFWFTISALGTESQGL